MPRGVRHSMHAGVSSVQLLEDINKETLARPARVGADSNCGCPGFAPVRLIDVTYPPQLAPIYSNLAWDSFLTSINRKLEETTVPDCPLLLGCLIPPVPCLFWYCRSSRAKEREEFIMDRVNEENERLQLVGLLWTDPVFLHKQTCCITQIPQLRGSIALQINLQRRAQFELDNPQTNQFLANLLLQRTEAAAGGRPMSPSVRSKLVSELDVDQAKLLNRQVTLVRKQSMSFANANPSGTHSKNGSEVDAGQLAGLSSANGSSSGTAANGGATVTTPALTASDANTMWASPVNKPGSAFQPIVTTEPPPLEEQMK